MKQKISIILLIAYVSGSIILYTSGIYIRNVLTPSVDVMQADLTQINDMVCFVIPQYLTFTDDDTYYVYIIERDDKFSEPSYIAVRKDLNIIAIDKANIYVTYHTFLNNESIIIPKTMPLYDEMRVKYSD